MARSGLLALCTFMITMMVSKGHLPLCGSQLLQALLMCRGEAHRGAPALITSHSKHVLVC